MGRDRWNNWLEKIKNNEKIPKKNHLLILFLTGMILFAAVFPFPSGDREITDGNSDGTDTGGNESKLGQYESYLEEKTECLLGQVDGAGEVTVMLTLKSGTQKIVEKDQNNSSQKTDEADSAGGTRTVEENTSERTSIYEQNSDGSSIPYVSKELSPEIEGVVVIADGGDDAIVIKSITEAVQALFGVEAHKIKIMKRA